MTENNSQKYWLQEFAVRRPVTIFMIFLGLAFWGLLSMFTMPVELKPNTSFSNVSVIYNVRGGMSPEGVERLITNPVEEALSTVSGLKSLYSTSRAGKASIILSFASGSDMNFKTLEISEKIDAITALLPSEAERPVIACYEQNDMPVMILSLSADDSPALSIEEIREKADKLIKPLLMRLDGVANVDIAGGTDKRILIEINESLLISRKLTTDVFSKALAEKNISLLAGRAENSLFSIPVRAGDKLKNLKEIENIVLSVKNKGDVIRIKDVAEVKWHYMEPSAFARFNGRNVVNIYIQKESQGNTVDICQKALQVVRKIKASYSGISFSVVENQSEHIKEVTGRVKSSLMQGAFLAVIVLWIFLRSVKALLLVCVTIPVSLLITLLLMKFSDLTINVMTLSGLALGTGMLVDNAIVVIENISTRIKYGSLRKAIIDGCGELLLSLCASTATTLIVFIPLVFVSSATKSLYGSMSLTMTYALISSLLASVLLLPAMAFVIKADFSEHREKRFKIFTHLLSLSIRRRYILFGGVGFMLLGALTYFSVAETDLGQDMNQRKFTVYVELMSGAKIDSSDSIVKKTEEILSVIPEIESYASRVEGWSSKIFVTLKKEQSRKIQQVMDQVKEKTRDLGKFEQAFIYTSQFKNKDNAPITVNIFGPDYKKLISYSDKITQKLKEKGFMDFKLRYKPGRPEMVVQILKEKAFLNGFSVREVADSLHSRIRGIRGTKIFVDNSEREVILRLDKAFCDSRNKIRDLILTNKYGKKVSLSEIAIFSMQTAPSEIWHLNKRRMIQLSFSAKNISLDRAADLTRKILSSIEQEKGYDFSLTKEIEEMKETYKKLWIAVVVTMLIIYMLLASLFESYSDPLVIMSAVPLSLIGVGLSSGLFNLPVSTGMIMGIMMLGGIVVNNSIVITDKFKQLNLLKHISFEKALILAGHNRLRPIVMTSLTTILGLVPMIIDSSHGANLWSALAITVCAGLIFSTIMTLLVVPAMLKILIDIKYFFKDLLL